MGKIALCNINCIDIEKASYAFNQTIEIEGEFITDVYDTKAHLPNECEVQYDYSGCWAIPGFVDMHLHITMSHCMSEPDYYVTPNEIVEIAYENLLALRRVGVTVCRDMGSYVHSAEWIKYILRNESSLPYILTCGDVITYPKGHMYEFGREIENVKDIDMAIDLNSNLKADFIKVASDPLDNEAKHRVPNPAFNIDMLQHIAEYGKKKKMFMACHTYPSKIGVMRALRGGARTIEHAVPFGDDMGRKRYPKTFYVPTFSTALDVCGMSRLEQFNVVKNNNVWDLVKDIMNENPVYFNEVPDSIDEWFQILINMLPNAIKTGQLLCIGSDAGCKGTDFSTVLREIFLMCVLGATNQQALTYATVNPYKALGYNTRGKIVRGNIADIVILNKNPLKDISALLNNEAVICKGQLISK